jgi:nitrate/nitrite transporter NarK
VAKYSSRYIYQGEPVLPASWQTAFNTVSSVGQFAGGFLCSWISDRIGRKRGLAIGIAICTGGILGEVLSVTRPAFLVSKLILGLGLGFYLTLAPLCCSEVSCGCSWYVIRYRNADCKLDHSRRPSRYCYSRCKSWDCTRPTPLELGHQGFRSTNGSLGIQRPLYYTVLLRPLSHRWTSFRPRVTLVSRP